MLVPKGELVRKIYEAESLVCGRLRPILASLPARATIPDSDDLRGVLSPLESLLPEVLREIHPEWKYESLDGILPELVRKTGDNEMELFGLCYLISDQSLAPLHLRLELDLDQNAVSWLECWLGESTADRTRRAPLKRRIFAGKKLSVFGRLDLIKWVYHVGYGERRNPMPIEH